MLLTPVRHLSFATLEPGLGDGADPPKAATGAHAAPSRTADGASGRIVSRVGQRPPRRPPRRRSSAARGGVRIAPKSRGRCTRPQERARARAAAERALARVEAPALAAAASASNPDSGRSMKRPAPGLGLHGHSRARARSTARSARRAAAAAARLARALAALHTQPLHSAATVMMTEATSDESVADPDSCMGPVPLRREETMVCGQAGAVPSYKDEETRTDSWHLPPPDACPLAASSSVTADLPPGMSP